MKLLNNLHLFESTGADSNCYLSTAGPIFIVDTGTGTRIDEFLNWILRQGVALSDIEFIVNTHYHYDHIGGNTVLKDKTGAQIAAHELDAPFIQAGDVSHILSEIPPINVERVLNEGDELGSFKVLHTPGHTPGSLCLYDAETKTLIAGDTVFGMGAWGRTDFPGGDSNQMYDSLKRLAAMDIENIFSGHEQVALENGNTVLQNILEGFKANQQTESIL